MSLPCCSRTCRSCQVVACDHQVLLRDCERELAQLRVADLFHLEKQWGAATQACNQLREGEGVGAAGPWAPRHGNTRIPCMDASRFQQIAPYLCVERIAIEMQYHARAEASAPKLPLTCCFTGSSGAL